MQDNPELKMTFDPHTIKHLGIKMYSHLPNALAELVANAYDACASVVTIKLFDQGQKRVDVIDDGIGMSFVEVNDKFLRIGRNRREEDEVATPCERTPTGKKGLGKLAFFGISDTIETVTKCGGQKVSFIMDWNDLITTSGDYKPAFELMDCVTEDHGTSISLTNLKRKTAFDANSLAISLSRLFNFIDSNFQIMLIHNDGEPIPVTNDLKYKNIDPEFTWNFPSFVSQVDTEYEHRYKVSGRVISTEKPLKPGLRGISLYANGRMVNQAEFFGSSESSHFFSYTTGWLEIDFVDEWSEDVIATNRQTLDWENDLLRGLEEFLKICLAQIHYDWRTKRKEKREINLADKTGINVPEWFKAVPSHVKQKLETIISSVVQDSELPEDQQQKIVSDIHALVPEYPEYHWRHLRPEIHEVSENDYHNKDYFRAAQEGVKKYENVVRDKTGLRSISKAYPLMQQSFGSGSSVLLLTPNLNESEQNIEQGQKELSCGLISGFRNPAAHLAKVALHPDLFSDKDCLDILSLTSYLIGKAEQAKKRGG